MGLHDVATVAGISEACRYNDHSECRAAGCGCTCHVPVASKPELSAIAESGPENACPKCGIKRPVSESYCRIDGSKLTSLACGMCGRGMNPEDAFCFNCGAPKGKVGQVKVVTVPEVESTSTRYEQQVLRGLQEELSNVQVDEANSGQAQVVIEQPAGSQGSFKLVSQPNPNKLRTPTTGGTTQPVRGTRGIRLPIKPA